jgi:hypothetical protein
MGGRNVALLVCALLAGLDMVWDLVAVLFVDEERDL